MLVPLLSINSADDFQVGRLHRVLQDKYNCSVYHKQINNKKKAQVQAHKYLADFVFDEDGERTLLIVYYAGHGFAGDKAGTLNLAGYGIFIPRIGLLVNNSPCLSDSAYPGKHSNARTKLRSFGSRQRESSITRKLISWSFSTAVMLET